jgi:cytochrome c6
MPWRRFFLRGLQVHNKTSNVGFSRTMRWRQPNFLNHIRQLETRALGKSERAGYAWRAISPPYFQRETRMKTILKAGFVVLTFALMFSSLALADGADTFKAKCAMCHGADGAGQTAMGKNMGLKDLGSADVQKQSDAALTATITNGKGKMPPYGSKLSADEIAGVVKYIRTLKK